MSQVDHSSQGEPSSQHVTQRQKRPPSSPLNDSVRAARAKLMESEESMSEAMVRFDQLQPGRSLSKDDIADIRNKVKEAFDKVKQATHDLLDQIVESNKTMETRIAKLEEQDEVRPNEQLNIKVVRLEQKIASMEKKEKKAQISLVANNIVIHTLKSNSETASYVRKLVQTGTDKEISDGDIRFYDIKNPMTETAGNVTRAILARWMKTGLFKALPAASRTPEGKAFRISNECPDYLRKKKKLLERISFSIRSQHPTTRTKISLKATDLVLTIKEDGDGDWFAASDARAEKYFNIALVYRAGESTPKETLTVGRALTFNKKN